MASGKKAPPLAPIPAPSPPGRVPDSEPCPASRGRPLLLAARMRSDVAVNKQRSSGKAAVGGPSRLDGARYQIPSPTQPCVAGYSCSPRVCDAKLQATNNESVVKQQSGGSAG